MMELKYNREGFKENYGPPKLRACLFLNRYHVYVSKDTRPGSYVFWGIEGDFRNLALM